MSTRPRVRHRSRHHEESKQQQEQQVTRIQGDEMDLVGQRGKDGSMEVVDEQAATAKRTLLWILTAAERAVNDGLKDVLLNQLAKLAEEKSAEAQGSIAKFIGGKIFEAGIKAAGEVAEGAAAPVLWTIKIGSLAEAMHKANVNVTEAATIKALVERYRVGIVELVDRAKAAVEMLDGNALVDLAVGARVGITPAAVAHEFQEQLEAAMILHGYAARDAIDHVRAKLDGRESSKE